MLRITQERHEELFGIKYCWIDTWCIDQNDPEDKRRQIPMMGEIYRNALCVVVTVRHRFSFTQEDWNAILQKLQEPILYTRDRIITDSDKAVAAYEALHISKELDRALEIIREFNELVWMKRVWTAQEYILAARLVCIGGDLHPFDLLSDDMNSIILIHMYKSRNRLGEFDSLRILNHVRKKLYDPTLAMELAIHRKSCFPEDEVYGLMVISGVVIKPISNASTEQVWRAWLEQSIRAGHLLWAVLPQDVQARVYSYNCIIPSFESRRQSLVNNRVQSTPLLGPVEIQNGAVKFSGFIAGTCTIITSLGHIKHDEDFITMVVATTKGDLDLTRHIYAALCSGSDTKEESGNSAQWQCALYRQDSMSWIRKVASRRLRKLKSKIGEPKGMRVNLWAEGNAFLAFVENDLKSTPIIVFMVDQIPEGRLVAVDLNAKAGSSENEKHILMIVSMPPDGVLRKRSLHKVGISSAVFIPKDQDVERAKNMNGHVYDRRIETFEVGGEGCWYCSKKKH